MSDWFIQYSDTLLGGLVALLASSVVVQVAPIKLNPWTWLAKKIGRAINGEVTAQLAEISDKLDAHIYEDDKNDAKRARVRILRFADEILQGSCTRRNTSMKSWKISPSITATVRGILSSRTIRQQSPLRTLKVPTAREWKRMIFVRGGEIYEPDEQDMVEGRRGPGD